MDFKMEKKKKEKRIREMEQDLSETPVSEEICGSCARVLASKGYRPERYSEWILDTDFESRTKLRYRCSACGYWRTVKTQNAASMLHGLRYCPGCGARTVRGRRAEGRT